MRLTLRQHKQEGDISWNYSPLRNIIDDSGNILDFDVPAEQFDVDLHHPVNIECQPSYDGTVNLIINDDKNPPRIVNSRFAKVEGNKYKIITRNQKEQTNLYKIDKVDQQTRLFRTLNKIPKFNLYNISYFGQLKGGNYNFYLKFADNDYNKTDIVAETGEIPVFKGTLSSVKTISGPIAEERTDKSIKLRLTNIDTSFSKIYLCYSRSTSDLNGIRETVYEKIIKPYDITGSEMIITIDGFEQVESISEEELNIRYNVVDAVKTQTQVQNRLFFANVNDLVPNNKELQNISYYIQVKLSNKTGDNNSIGHLDTDYKSNSTLFTNSEYYSPQNVYYRLGYWPEEMYRLGIVYIMNNDTLSPVYQLRGISFDKVGDYNYDANVEKYSSNGVVNYIEKQDFLNDFTFSNTMGVFKNPSVDVFDANKTTPLYYKMIIGADLIEALKSFKVKGFFFVRQKRIPTILGQALELGINKNCYIPMPYYNNNYIAEGFRSTETGLLTTNLNNRLLKTTEKQSSGLLSVDALVRPEIRSLFDGTEFVLTEAYSTSAVKEGRRFKYNFKAPGENPIQGFISRLNFVPTECPAKVIEDFVYSTKQGSEFTVSEFGWWNTPGGKEYKNTNPELVRGVYSGFIASNLRLKNGSVYNIKINKFNVAFLKDYFLIRGNDNSPFFAISERYSIYDDINESSSLSLDVYRGDCYINTVTVRLNRNFVDPSVPIDDYIVDDATWKDNYKGYYGAIYVNDKDATDRQTTAIERIADFLANPDSVTDDKFTNFSKINRADVNAVPLGMWITFKCLSNYNLGLRAIDERHPDEQALMGNPRAFYPFVGTSTKSGLKVNDSELQNDGFNSTVGDRVNFKYEDVPYIKDQFDNRIMFSNVQVNDQFKNSYRIFQGLSYQDIDRQYGAIVKIYPWSAGGSANLLCVFEHGIGIVGINEKALVQTTTNKNIHFYGAGVVSPDVTILSEDFGSTWQDSIIKTPLAIYGVDTYCKKIWKVPLDNSGITCISDQAIQKFLNDNISFKESDKTPIIGLRNVKAHYNNYKGDVMFTFYDYENNKEWNFCYNERLRIWTTRYSWVPLYSENINNSYFSFDKKRAEILSYVSENNSCEYGLRIDKENKIDSLLEGVNLTLVGYEKFNANFTYDIKQIKYGKNNETFIIKDTSPYLIKNNTFIQCTPLLSNLNADWYLIDIEVTPSVIISEIETTFAPFNYSLAFVGNLSNIRNGFYIHGRSNTYDELNYFDEDQSNNIRPTYWYDKQEPFEFEFVVSEPAGLHKIFDNLVIISNNVKPKEIEFEITGDVYDFNKAGLYWDESKCTDVVAENHEFDEKYNPIKHGNINGQDIEYQISQVFKNTNVVWDNSTNTYSLKLTQPCKDLKDPQYGRLLGNIHYKEDSWYLTIDPIKYKTKYKISKINGVASSEETVSDDTYKSTRLRDKYCKIRVKYSGEDLAIITSLKTIVTMSYA